MRVALIAKANIGVAKASRRKKEIGRMERIHRPYREKVDSFTGRGVAHLQMSLFKVGKWVGRTKRGQAVKKRSPIRARVNR